MFKQILQVYSHLISEDGVSQVILDIAAILDEHKIDNRIFGLTMSSRIKNDKKWFNIELIEESITPDTLVIFHFAMPTDLCFIVKRLKCPKVFFYHNVTPPVFFEKYDVNLQNILADGLRQVVSLASFIPCAWSVSEYNCSQLRNAGFTRTAVASLPFDYKRYSEVKPRRISEKRDGVKNILFVGRIAPNKRQEDIIRAFYYYHRINPNSELTLIGSYEHSEKYRKELIQLSDNWKLPVNMKGLVPLDELVAHYQNADLFLCMSEHEGFCIPLIEAMYFKVPVIAYDSSAVTETVGDAGIVFHQKHFPYVAHLMDEVLKSKKLQEVMIDKGKERSSAFSKEWFFSRLIGLINDYANEFGI